MAACCRSRGAVAVFKLNADTRYVLRRVQAAILEDERKAEKEFEEQQVAEAAKEAAWERTKKAAKFAGAASAGSKRQEADDVDGQTEGEV